MFTYRHGSMRMLSVSTMGLMQLSLLQCSGGVSMKKQRVSTLADAVRCAAEADIHDPLCKDKDTVWVLHLKA